MKKMNENEMRVVNGGARYECRWCGKTGKNAFKSYVTWLMHFNFSSYCLMKRKQNLGW